MPGRLRPETLRRLVRFGAIALVALYAILVAYFLVAGPFDFTWGGFRIRLRTLEKPMWIIAGALAALAFTARHRVRARLSDLGRRIAGEPAPLVVAAVLSAVLLSYMGNTATPTRYGDGGEYFLMLEAFSRHSSFDLRKGDWKGFEQLLEKERKETRVRKWGKPFPYGGFLRSLDGKLFGYHFWLYPLLAAPAKELLHDLEGTETKAFQITNAVLLGLLLVAASLLLKLDPHRKILFLLLLFFNPALWYVHWTHPELFTYSAVTLSLLLSANGRFIAAIFFSSLASTQNPPILCLTLFHVASLFRALVPEIRSAKRLLAVSAKAFVAFTPTWIPSLFFYVHYRTLNQIQAVGASDFALVSFRRIGELLFDPNIGVFPYMPLVTLVAFAIVLASLVRVGRTIAVTRSARAAFSAEPGSFGILGLALVLFLELALASSAGNWNHGASGPSRYVIWSAVPILLAIIGLRLRERCSLALGALLVAALCLNAWIVSYGGLFVPRRCIDSRFQSYLAEFLLDVRPAAYNPTPEIFAERVLHAEPLGGHELVIYKNDDEICRKALIDTTPENRTELENACGSGYSIGRCVTETRCYVDYP